MPSLLSQDVDIPEQVEKPEPAAPIAPAARQKHQPDGAAPPPAAPKELADGQMITKSAPCISEEAAPTADGSTTAAEDSDVSFRRAQSDTELVRPCRPQNCL